MQAYDWPGNVRACQRVEHAMVLCDELPIRLEHLPFRIQVPRKRSSVISGSGDSGTNASRQDIHEGVGFEYASEPQAD